MLNPTFTTEQIQQLDTSNKMSRAIDGTMYLPGIVGLNNIKANDYCNVILQVSIKQLDTRLREVGRDSCLSNLGGHKRLGNAGIEGNLSVFSQFLRYPPF